MARRAFGKKGGAPKVDAKDVNLAKRFGVKGKKAEAFAKADAREDAKEKK